jgi:hypothetical protein
MINLFPFETRTTPGNTPISESAQSAGLVSSLNNFFAFLFLLFLIGIRPTVAPYGGYFHVPLVGFLGIRFWTMKGGERRRWTAFFNITATDQCCMDSTRSLLLSILLFCSILKARLLRAGKIDDGCVNIGTWLL